MRVKFVRYKLRACILLCVGLQCGAGFTGTRLLADSQPAHGGIAEYRIQVLKLAEKGAEALPEVEKAAQHENALVRRAAVRSLQRIGEPAREVLKEVCLQDKDVLVRRTALRALVDLSNGEELMDLLAQAYRDSSPLVREAAISEAAAVSPRDGRILALLQQGQQDSDVFVSRKASESLWPYHAEVKSSRLRPEYQDLDMKVVERLDLPLEGWVFKPDPLQNGHIHGWQTREFEPIDWAPVGIAKPWQEFGQTHEGVGWYRLQIELPEKADYDIADLVFEAVDQSAWVWVNGKYVGAHDLGSSGWNKPFATDVGDILEWGKVNQITVRVLKPSGGHAGIWKPAYLELMKR